MKQMTFASAAWQSKGKVTRRERFLAEMDAVIPWDPIQALIEPHYPKARNGTQPMPLERLLLKSGTIVDATIIAAPPSTKNAEGKRDPEMHQTKKGKDRHFGMKAHVGADRRGIVHSLTTTAANVHDSTQMAKLLHGQEREVFGDQAYWNESHRQDAQARAIRYRINRRPNGRDPLTARQRAINRIRSRTRARGEHAFHVVKRLWGFNKVRHRGLAKKTARLFTAFALANLYLLRRRLMPSGETCRC